jgi:UDP-2,4-diacetamido-2,4,6-trideoxy-beta-L-altropyranose hydrolase
MGTDSKKPIIFRADVSQQIGQGHLMRCLALAQACRNANETPILLSQCNNEYLYLRIRKEGFEILPLDQIHPNPIDLNRTLSILEEYNAGWLVIDGYHFDKKYFEAIKEAGYRLLVIDDMAEIPEYNIDILLNQNIYADQLSYHYNSKTISLLGTKYALLRNEFSYKPSIKHDIPLVANKILVIMGGSDPNNVTLKALQALSLVTIEELEVTAIIGESNSNKDSIEKEISNLGLRIKLIEHPSNILDWMNWADIAITGGGSTCYELAFLGLPSLVFILAENQRRVSLGLEIAGCSINLGWYRNITKKDLALRINELAHSPKNRARMSKCGKDLVDGKGASRVVKFIKACSLTLRAAIETDCRMIYEWANDQVTRSVSFSTNTIQWDDHKNWFQAKLIDPNTRIFVALDSNFLPVGTVRYQIEEIEATISINVAPCERGKGYGSVILRLGSNKIFQETKVGVIHAYIKAENLSSIHAFENAGYRQEGIAEFQGYKPCHFVVRKELR